MITPALLISARELYSVDVQPPRPVVDRVRALSDRIEELIHAATKSKCEKSVRTCMSSRWGSSAPAVTFAAQPDLLLFRQRHVVLTSVAIGVISFVNERLRIHWFRRAGIVGALAMLVGSILLIREARLRHSLEQEMRFSPRW